MATLNEIIQPERKQINTLNTDFTSGKVYVDNSFQRRSVWVTKNRVRLIETILLGFPMPEIYLWSGKADPQSGVSSLSIVDGQQRLTAIRDYIANIFPLHSEHLDSGSEPYRDRTFHDLPTEFKVKIWEYHVTTRTIPSSVSREEIVKMFLRLNETDKSLNPQELRNAEFNGEFIKLVECIADLDFWDEHKIFRPSQIRRMGDLQFVSSLLIFLRSGVEAEVTQTAINKMYDTYNDKYDHKEEDLTTTADTLNDIGLIFKLSPEVAKFFRSAVHLYPLFIAILGIKSGGHPIDHADVARRLESFANEYSSDSRGALVSKYRLAATEGTQKRANREERILSLKEWLVGSSSKEQDS